jgi:hypothetical protein
MQRTWTFAISFVNASTPVAQGLICPEAKSIAVRWTDGRVDDRHIPDSVWQLVLQELGGLLPPGPVGRSSTISAVLVGSLGAVMTVSFVDVRMLPAPAAIQT